MIPDAEKKFQCAERAELAIDEIGPCFRQVVHDSDVRSVQFKFRGRHHILVKVVDGAQIAQMPVERRSTLQYAGSDGRHDDVTAIAGVA